MKFLITAILAAVLAAVLVMASAMAPADVRAEGMEKEKGPSVRYGERCGPAYGMLQRSANVQRALEALRAHFAKQGLEVKMLSHNIRFLNAAIFNGTNQVDVVIMDMRTGQMRSAY